MSDLSQYSPYWKKKQKTDSDNKDGKPIEDNSPVQIFEGAKNEEIRVLLKVFDKELLKEEEDYEFHLEQIQKEKEISYVCNSNYTLKINRDFETEKYIVFEKEYADMELKEYLFENGPFEQKYVGKDNLKIFKNITIDIANALKVINEKGVVHRNIKPHNIYLTENGAKLADFSCAIYVKEINNSVPMGTILYTAPEIIKNLNYNEKCDMWSVGLTLFEIYFGCLPYGFNANTKIINDIIYNENNFNFRKSGIPTLDILFKSLLQIDPKKRMSHSEFYNFVTNEKFLDKEYVSEDIKYMELYEQILQSEQVEYKEVSELKKEKFNEEEAEKQNLEKILGFVEGGNLPDIMNFSNASVKKEEIYNNIIYYDTNIKGHKKDIHHDSDKFERITPGAFILCTNLVSLNIIKEEILKYRKSDKKVFFNIISNGSGFRQDLEEYLKENKDFREIIKKICIYCMNPKNHYELKAKYKDLIEEVTNSTERVFNFIKNQSSKDIKPFPLTKLVRIDDYLQKYKERHIKVSEFYGNLNPEEFKKKMGEIKEVINKDEEQKLLKKKKEKVLEGFLTFNLEKDLQKLDELIIREYTKNTFYGDLNRWLMKGKMKDYEPVAYFTSRLMFSLNSYAQKRHKFCKEDEKVLHRGAQLFYSCLLPYERAVGDIILLSAFTSTSESDEIAKKWAGRGREKEIYNNSSKFSVVFHIKNNYKEKNWISNSIDIQNKSMYKKEREFLFQPFSFYKVIKVDINEKTFSADITLETIGKKEILEEQIKNGKSVKYNINKNIMEAL